MAINVENERLAPPGALAAAKARIAELEQRIEQLEAKARVAICLWCQARVEKSLEAISVHWNVCPSHPMRQLERGATPGTAGP